MHYCELEKKKKKNEKSIHPLKNQCNVSMFFCAHTLHFEGKKKQWKRRGWNSQWKRNKRTSMHEYFSNITIYIWRKHLYLHHCRLCGRQEGMKPLLLAASAFKEFFFSPQNLYVNLSAFLHYNNGRVLNTNGKRGIRQTAYFNILFPPTKLYRHYQPTTITPPFMCIFQKKKKNFFLLYTL